MILLFRKMFLFSRKCSEISKNILKIRKMFLLFSEKSSGFSIRFLLPFFKRKKKNETGRPSAARGMRPFAATEETGA